MWRRQQANEPQASGLTRILYGASGAGMSDKMDDSRCLLGAAMHDLTPGEGSASIKHRIGKLAGSRDAHGWELPKGMDVEDFFEHLVHRGALQRLPDKSVHCPIPSFRRYMIGLGKK